MYILGISALYHDSAICLLKNGVPVFSASEERFTRKKHDDSFPINAINTAFSHQNITINEVELICFYEKPFQKFERIIDTYSEHSPIGFRSFKKAIQSWFTNKLWIKDSIKSQLNYKGEIIFAEHHESHAAGTFFTSPFKEATFVTMDGVGEKSTASIGIGKDNEIKILETQDFPHSVGLFYSAITYYCGFKVNSGEYKLMGLAPYGNPIYIELMKQNFISVNEDGSIKLVMKHFNFEVGLRMIKTSFEKVLEQKRRTPESDFSQFYKDIAASAQAIVEEVLLKTVKYAIALTGVSKVCLSGGVALNCKANSKLHEFFNPEDIWVQPASGDSGGAMGCAYVGWYHHLQNKREILSNSPTSQVYLGSEFTKEEVKRILIDLEVNFSEFSENETMEFIADKLKSKQIIGWFHDRMEFGPRALGNRSILASPVFKDMKVYVNQRIKLREDFRPFAPVVLEERRKDWFEMESPSKYMLSTYQAKNKESIPSCVHEDLSARVQTLSEEDNPLLHKLLLKIEEKTKVPILINTSFNVRGEPIVESPIDALNCFFNTEMDVLVIEGIVILKEENNSISWNKNQQYALD